MRSTSVTGTVRRDLFLENKLDTRYKTVFSKYFAISFDILIFIIINYVILFFDKNLNYLYMKYATILYCLYLIICHSIFGKTLGKAIYSLTVLNIDELKKISIFQSIIRELVPLIFAIFYTILKDNIKISYFVNNSFNIYNVLLISYTLFYFGWYISELLIILFNNKRRGLNDIISKVVIIKNKQLNLYKIIFGIIIVIILNILSILPDLIILLN
jgi:uncharacterized RDD family membrane protein YckC